MIKPVVFQAADVLTAWINAPFFFLIFGKKNTPYSLQAKGFEGMALHDTLTIAYFQTIGSPV